jgi:hypothetical protein
MSGAPAKNLQVLGLLAKIESTYGTPIALSTTSDGVQLQYKDRNQGAIVTIDYAFDGDLGPSVSALGQTLNVAPAGRSGKADFPHRSRPGGAAYSASVVPSLHTFLKMCGFDATLTTSVGNEKWVYTPTPPSTVPASATMGLYTRGELWSLAGGYGSLKMDAPDPAPPIWTASVSGIFTPMPSDASVPAITYPLQSVAPLLGSTLSLTLGNLSTNAVVYSHSFDMQRTMDPRVPQSGGGAHLGFVPVDRAPQIVVEIEATALTTTPFTSTTAFDPYMLRDSGQQFAAILQHGSTQYFRQKMTFAQAQVIKVEPSSRGVVATHKLTIAAANSTASAIDDISFTFD